MNPIGLVSVTLRQKSAEEIVELCHRLALDHIEWGSDVHVVANQLEKAVAIAKLCQQRQCKIFSYGTYYKLCQNNIVSQDFLALIRCAQSLQTNTLRIWAGRTSSNDADENFFLQAVAEGIECATLASMYGMRIAFEYHRHSLTDCSQSAIRLLKAINMDNCFIYWQPNPELSIQQNKEELQAILPYLCAVHVFYWQPDNTRLALQKGLDAWKCWLPLIDDSIPLLLEFVLDDSVEQVEQDCHTLQRWNNKELPTLKKG